MDLLDVKSGNPFRKNCKTTIKEKTNVQITERMDNELERVLFLLLNIHKKFFFDKRLKDAKQQIEGGGPKVQEFLAQDVYPLRGTRIMFSGIFKTTTNPFKSQLAIATQKIGAKVVTTFEEKPTHLVLKPLNCKTRKRHEAEVNHPHIKITSLKWLRSCIALTERLPESDFPLPKPIPQPYNPFAVQNDKSTTEKSKNENKHDESKSDDTNKSDGNQTKTNNKNENEKFIDTSQSTNSDALSNKKDINNNENENAKIEAKSENNNVTNETTVLNSNNNNNKNNNTSNEMVIENNKESMDKSTIPSDLDSSNKMNSNNNNNDKIKNNNNNDINDTIKPTNEGKPNGNSISLESEIVGKEESKEEEVPIMNTNKEVPMDTVLEKLLPAEVTVELDADTILPPEPISASISTPNPKKESKKRKRTRTKVNKASTTTTTKSNEPSSKRVPDPLTFSKSSTISSLSSSPSTNNEDSNNKMQKKKKTAAMTGGSLSIYKSLQKTLDKGITSEVESKQKNEMNTSTKEKLSPKINPVSGNNDNKNKDNNDNNDNNNKKKKKKINNKKSNNNSNTKELKKVQAKVKVSSFKTNPVPVSNNNKSNDHNNNCNTEKSKTVPAKVKVKPVPVINNNKKEKTQINKKDNNKSKDNKKKIDTKNKIQKIVVNRLSTKRGVEKPHNCFLKTKPVFMSPLRMTEVPKVSETPSSPLHHLLQLVPPQRASAIGIPPKKPRLSSHSSPVKGKLVPTSVTQFGIDSIDPIVYKMQRIVRAVGRTDRARVPFPLPTALPKPELDSNIPARLPLKMVADEEKLTAKQKRKLSRRKKKLESRKRQRNDMKSTKSATMGKKSEINFDEVMDGLTKKLLNRYEEDDDDNDNDSKNGEVSSSAPPMKRKKKSKVTKTTNFSKKSSETTNPSSSTSKISKVSTKKKGQQSPLLTRSKSIGFASTSLFAMKIREQNVDNKDDCGKVELPQRPHSQ
eukprot:TRINITY_DN23_c1_g1_i1.p1 TRINITY_DN23_c1_g1~~TRINITY_DN23_c1_g1_i1.p1  ORF type:complete len:1058 (+),score=333.69 TRINITY_DN23_c1_g1_i1:270-3176(+)